MDYNLYQEDMLTSHYRIRDYNVFLERKLSKSGFYYRRVIIEKSNKFSKALSMQRLSKAFAVLECHFEIHVALSLNWAYHYYAQINHR